MQLIPKENFRSPAAMAILLIVTCAGLALDLWTKAYSFDALRVQVNEQGRVVGSDRNVLITGWLQFEGQTNKGAVFGMGEGQLALFLVVSVAAILFLLYLFATSGRQRIYQFILGKLLAGVLGTLYDRVQFGYVRDMIHALPGQVWPGTSTPIFPWIFNVADILLCTGVGAMFGYIFLLAPKPHDQPNAEPDANARRAERGA